MRLKKTMALICTLAMASSVAVSSAIVAEAADGYSVALDFAGYEVKGTTTFAKVNVNLTVPDELSPYTMNAADWETTFEDTYSGLALQAIGIDIPYVTGLTYIASLSSAQEPVAIQDNAGEKRISLYHVNTGSYETYYAGELNKTLATLYYRITGDVAGTYDMSIDSCSITYSKWEGTSSTPTAVKHLTGDFTVTGCSVKPAVATEYTVTFKADDVEVSSVKVAENGTVATLPDAPAKDGYTFSKWVANGEEFTTSTVITADTTVTAEYTYGTPIKTGDYAGKTLYLNEEGTTTFNFGTDKAIQITKKVGETTESRTFGKKWLAEKTGVEGEGNTTFTLGIIDTDGLAKGTFTFKVLQSLEGIE